MSAPTPPGDPVRAFAQPAEWYDAFNAGKDYAAEVGDLLRVVERWRAPPGSWLDVGCGTGRHLSHLQGKVPHLEGVDASASLLQAARARLPGVPLHLGQAQALDLGRRVDVVSMLFHGVGYLASDEALDAALRRFAAHLTDEGLLVFDFWNSEGVRRAPPTARTRRV